MAKEKTVKCPKCGYSDIEIIKNWQLTSPFPDKYGRITITIMGVMQCGKCGHKWRGVISKIKAGGSSIAINDKEIRGEERRVKEIVLDLDEILAEEEE